MRRRRFALFGWAKASAGTVAISTTTAGLPALDPTDGSASDYQDPLYHQPTVNRRPGGRVAHLLDNSAANATLPGAAAVGSSGRSVVPSGRWYRWSSPVEAGRRVLLRLRLVGGS